MEVNLYENTSENYRITKSITLKASEQCVLKDDCSVENPVIVIKTGNNISGYNYMYIPDFGRYYYIGDIVSIGYNMWEVHGHVDVLMSYANEIKACNATFKRQENMFNMYLDDPEFHTYNKSEIVTKLFSGGTTNLNKAMSYILVVAGG